MLPIRFGRWCLVILMGVGCLTKGEAGTYAAAPADLFEYTLQAHESAQAGLRTGEGRMTIEMHQESVGYVAPLWRHLDPTTRDRMRKEQGIDPDNGWFRADYRWWFSGSKYRLDRSVSPLRESERILAYQVGDARSVFNGEVDLQAGSPSLLKRNPATRDRWMLHIRPHARAGLGLEQRLLRDDAVDIRAMQMWQGYTLRAYLKRLQEPPLGLQMHAEEKAGKLILSATAPGGREEYHIDPDQGYNITYAVGINEEQNSKWLTFSGVYQHIGTHWVPKELSYTFVLGVGSDGRQTTTLKAVMTDVKLGEQVDETLFTMAGMGLPEGTTVYDWRVSPVRTFALNTKKGHSLEDLPKAAQNRGVSATLPATQPAGLPREASPPRSGSQPATRPAGRSPLSLQDASRLARPEMAPQLLEMLKDPAYAEDWGLIAKLLPAASPDARSVSAIIDYITRKDDWRGLDEPSLNGRVAAKLSAVEALGWIGGPEAIAFLRKAVESRKDREEILGRWIPNERSSEIHGGSQPTTFSIFMNQAANSLVISRDPDGIALIRQRNQQFGYHARAMAINRVIEERGLDWYRQNRGGAAASPERKYWLEYYRESRQKWGRPLPPLPSRPSDRPSGPATRPEADLVAEFGTSRSEPVDKAFFFWEGRYVEAPYAVERRGLEVFVNGIRVARKPPGELEWPPYDYTVSEDPGDPPPGLGPGDQTPKGVDYRDTYWARKWRYLFLHYDRETARQKMRETYARSDQVADVSVHPLLPSATVVRMKSGETRNFDALPDGWANRGWPKPTKDQVLKAVEFTHDFYKRRLSVPLVLAISRGTEVSCSHQQALKFLQILLSDKGEKEKRRLLGEHVGVRPDDAFLKELVQTLQTSPQLARRLKVWEDEVAEEKSQLARRLKQQEEQAAEARRQIAALKALGKTGQLRQPDSRPTTPSSIPYDR
jgi:hypothetical protein